VLDQILRPSYRVLAATSGERALLAAQRPATRPDLILLDVMMPQMDGFTLLTRLREQENTRDIPVIFVTALEDEADEEHGLALGAVDYITKPIKAAVVLARVRTQLELKQARDRLQDQNHWLEAEVARRLRDNLLIQDVTLCTLVELVESRDRETGNHIQRTQAYVETLARRMQRDRRFGETLSEGDLRRIIKAAPLHDIGKIGIPDHILLKPGPLSREEFEVMKGHCRIGGEAILHAMRKGAALYPEQIPRLGEDALAFLRVASTIAMSHHERWDGGGYPEGLAGAAIPLPARLMAVADVYDALTTRRIYKAPTSPAEAAAHIRAEHGGHFDPDICEAFFAAMGEFQEIYRRFAAPEPVEIRPGEHAP
jgi:putative two-component system response regulator